MGVGCQSDISKGKGAAPFEHFTTKFHTFINQSSIIFPDISTPFHTCSNQYGSDAMVQELEGSQNVFATPLLETAQKLTQVRQGRG